MRNFNHTIIVRHRRENLKKCSLRGLETLEGLQFLTYPSCDSFDFSGTLLLTMDAPPLTEEDAAFPLLLLDATWRLAKKMERCLGLENHPERISLPGHFRTAYPRRQQDCPDPERGLSSIEALFVAHTILKRETSSLFSHYHWKEEFLLKNKDLLLSSDRKEVISCSNITIPCFSNSF